MKRLQLFLIGENYEGAAVLLYVTIASIITSVTDKNEKNFHQ